MIDLGPHGRELIASMRRAVPDHLVFDERDELRPNMRVFVNGLGVRDLGHGLQRDDFVAVVLALSGG